MATVTREQLQKALSSLSALEGMASGYCELQDGFDTSKGIAENVRQVLAAFAAQPAEDENTLRAAWEAGFRLCRRYGDNHHHWDGEQRERRWREYLAQAAQAPPASDPPGLPRYGVTWKGGENEPLLTPMVDGYWTPWHLATRQTCPLPASPQAETTTYRNRCYQRPDGNTVHFVRYLACQCGALGTREETVGSNVPLGPQAETTKGDE